MEEKNKMTYEQLENVAHQLSEQNFNLRKQLQEINMEVSFKRLEFLFSILKYREMFPVEFVLKVTDEIIESMTIPDTNESENTLENK